MGKSIRSKIKRQHRAARRDAVADLDKVLAAKKHQELLQDARQQTKKLRAQRRREAREAKYAEGVAIEVDEDDSQKQKKKKPVKVGPRDMLPVDPNAVPMDIDEGSRKGGVLANKDKKKPTRRRKKGRHGIAKRSRVISKAGYN